MWEIDHFNHKSGKSFFFVIYSQGRLVGIIVQRVLVEVAEHLEHNGLRLDVVNERLGHCHSELEKI